jgi:Amt family ammonium transporter
MESKVAIDTLWVVVASGLVFFMNAGFAFLESGLCRAKNTANILGKNVLVFCLAALAFFAVGYAIAFTGKQGLFLGNAPSPAGVPATAFFLFQACFAATAASIVSGAVAERIKYQAYLVFAFVLVLVPYAVVARSIWGGGFLAQWGFHDFAGSTVVHSFGGWAALAGILLLGPRLGRYAPDGKPRPMPGHSMPLATLGTFILWIGWFGFNGGSVLAVDESMPRVVVVTVLASAAGGVAATMLAWTLLKKPDLTMTLNGILGGLVAITAPCGVAQPSAAVLIGLVAGVLVVFAVPMFDRMKIDDPVGALSVHLVNGIFGTLAVGLFAAPELRMAADGAQMPYGLLMGGGLKLLSVQAAGIAIVGAFTLATSLALWAVIKRTLGLRASEEEERIGLDRTEMGVEGYAAEVMGGRYVEPVTGHLLPEMPPVPVRAQTKA